MRGRVWFYGDLCVAALFHGNRVIWEDNSSRKAWPQLMADAHEVTKAAQIMAAKGQRFEEWRIIVHRASLE